MTDGATLLPQMLQAAFLPHVPARLGVAVSGGSDSLALLHLLSDWSVHGGPSILAVTVDHGLRPESAMEAKNVAKMCENLGVEHKTLQWTGWDGVGNLPDQARRARYQLMADWAHTQKLSAIALGHTADDQAETLLMRLARGSGVDGLASMAGIRYHRGINWHRPLLGARRLDLRKYLSARGVHWIDDPTNDDANYERVRVRRALAVLEPLGITTDGLCATAARMQMAQATLMICAETLARKIVRIEAGDIVFDPAELASAPEETRFRLLSHALCWVSSAEYRPRFSALKAVLEKIAQGKRMTLHGCLILPRKRSIRIVREPAAVATCQAKPDGIWDGRWRVTGPDISHPGMSGVYIGALGEAGLAQCANWRDSGLVRASLLASPAVWRDGQLLAAPLAEKSSIWRAELSRGEEDFFALLIVH